MSEWLSEYWYLVIVFLAVLILTVFGMYNAVKATANHNKNFANEEKKIKRLVSLKKKFSVLDEAAVNNSDDMDLLEGVALYYQLKLQKEDDMTEAFEKISLPSQYVYTLDIFSSEGGKLGEFYRNNGKPLTKLLIPAFEAIGEDIYVKYAQPVSRMLDPDDESASVNYATIDECENGFAEIYNTDEFKKRSAEYIRNHRAEIIDKTDNN